MSDSKASRSHISLAPEWPTKTIEPFSEHELRLERQAVRKLDYTIMPIMTMLYIISSLDRSNIGNARVAGLQKDLHMTDRQYQICITVFYLPHIAAELPANLLFRKIGPRVFVPSLVIIWGILATLQGCVTSYGGLVTLRVFLGLVEGPLSPAITLYLSSFYTRKDLSLRIAIFSCSIALGGTISGLLAAAIEDMDGIGGKPGWAWIFILEGLASVLAGFIGFSLVPSTPRDSKFLTENQKDLIMRRLERDRPCIKPVDKFTFKEVLRSVTSPHVIIMLIMAFMLGTITSGISLFIPSIVLQLGFSPGNAQLLSAGPAAAGLFGTLIIAFLSDHYESRGVTMAIVSMISVAGFALYLGAEHKFTLYGALYLIVPGMHATVPVLSAWLANNSETYYRRATTIALGSMIANAGNILSTWSFPTKDGPRFTKTTIRNLVFSILVVAGCLINTAYLSWRNKVKKRPGVRAKLLEKYEAVDKEGDGGELNAWTELGDGHPDFVYKI